MKYPIFCYFLLFWGVVFGQNKFAVIELPAELLKNADQVVRLFELNYDIKSRGEAVETEHKVITLLNKNAEDALEMTFGYDNFSKIEEIDAFVYQADGKLFKHLKKKDIEDVLAFQGFQFVTDNRMKLVHFPRLAWPFTIEYTVVTKTKNTMFLPEFQPQTQLRQSVQEAYFQILQPDGFPKINFLEENVPEISKTGPLSWHFQHLKAIQLEPFSPLNKLPTPRVVTAPTEFKVGEVEGSMKSWDEFGHFIQKLNSTQRELPADFLQKLRAIVADCSTDSCKIDRIYQFLQDNTRYFYVGFGIGGWQPAPAAKVHEYKYGDCKGLSNYTVQMLRAVGINANYVLINAGKTNQNLAISDLPNARFNHATVCVPSEKDTIWLECTSQNLATGFVSDFTDNRSALMITENGARFVHTPKYAEQENTTRRTVDIALHLDGSAQLKSTTKERAIAQDFSSQLMEMPHDFQLKYLYKILNISDFEIKKLEFEQKKARIPEVTQRLELDVPHLGSVSGKRIFVPISIFTESLEMESTSETRRWPIQADSRGFSEENQVTYTLPEGYFLENEIAPFEEKSVFGKFEISVVSDRNLVKITQKMVINDTIQPAEKWPDFQNFQKAISKSLHSKLVFVKKT